MSTQQTELQYPEKFPAACDTKQHKRVRLLIVYIGFKLRLKSGSHRKTLYTKLQKLNLAELIELTIE